MVLWLLIVIAVDHGHKTVPMPQLSPNPTRAPASMLGLGEVLVYADPYLAGTFYLWVVPGIALFALLVLWAMGAPVLIKKRYAGPSEPGLLKVAVASLAIGAFLAMPWLYALVCVLNKTVS
jgi:hypothetical protein